MMSDTSTELIAALSREGYQITYQRLRIIEAICQTGQFDNIEEFWLQLRGNFPIGIATVYTNIHLLLDKGWLVKLPCGGYVLCLSRYK